MLLRMVNRFRAAVLSTDKGGNSPDERKIARGGRKKEMRLGEKEEEKELPQREPRAAEFGERKGIYNGE